MLAEAARRSSLIKSGTGAIRALCVLAALGIAFLAQQGLAIAPAKLDQPLMLYGIAIILFAVAVWRQGETQRDDSVPTSASLKLGVLEKVVRGVLGAGGVALLSYASYVLTRAVIGPYKVNSLEISATLYGLGIITLVLAFSFLSGPQPEFLRRVLWAFSGKARWIASHRLESLGVLFVLALAIGMRVYQLDVYPPGLGGDEGLVGTETNGILANPSYRPIYNALSYYVIAFAFKLGGQSIFIARLTTVAVGVLTVLFLYLLVRLILGPRFAFLSAVLLATSRWHNNQSRSLLDLAYVPLFEVAAIYFLWRGMKSRRLLSFFWSALAITLGLYCYVAFRVVPIVLLAFLASKLVLDRHLIFQNWRGLAVFIASLLVLGAPYWTILVTNYQLTTGRPSGVLILNNKDHEGALNKQDIDLLLDNARKVYLQFNNVGDSTGMSNIPRMPMLDPWSGFLFVLGVSLAVLYWWREENLLWSILFLSTTFLGGVLTTDQPHSGRIIGVVPIIALLAVNVLYLAWKTLVGVLGERAKEPLYVLLAVPVFLAGYQNYDTFFNRQILDRAVYAGWAPGITAVGQQAGEMGKGVAVYLLGNFYFGHPPFQFAGKQPQGRNSYAIADSAPSSTIGATGIGYVADGAHAPWLTVAEAYYPGGKYEETYDKYGGLLAASYFVPKDLADKTTGLVGRYFANTNWQGEPTLTRSDQSLAFDWSKERPVDGSFSVAWAGALIAPKSGSYTLGVRTGDIAELTVDGEVVLKQEVGQELRETRAKLNLAEGLHQIAVKYATSGDSRSATTTLPRIELLWESQAAGIGWQVIPGKMLVATPTVYGLNGTYYAGSGPEGTVIRQRIDPLLWFSWWNDPFPKPEQERFHVKWTGFLQVETAGRYVFDTNVDGRSSLQLDGRSIPWSAPVEMSSGLHPLQVEYYSNFANGWFNLLWIPPGGKKEPLPPTVLRPTGTAKLEGEGSQTSIVVEGTPPVGKVGNDTATSDAGKGPLYFSMPEIWGTQGKGQGQFSSPRGGATDQEGFIYVADTGNSRIQKLDKNGSSVATWDVPRGKDGRTAEPVDIAVISGTLVVLEKQEGTLLRYALDGSYLGQLGTTLFPKASGLGSDKQGNVYVADTPAGRIVKLSGEGEILSQIKGSGGANQSLKSPTDVAVADDGSLFVVDPGRRGVYAFSSNGDQVRSWPSSNSEVDDAPQIALSRDGFVLVGDPKNQRVTMYSTDGRGLVDIGPFSQPPMAFNRPSGIWVDDQNRIYVADTAAHRIQRFVRQ